MSEEQTELDGLLDGWLLEILRKGIPCTDKNGNVVVDSEGIAVFKPPSPAYIREARQRLKDLGYNKIPNADDPVPEIAKELAGRQPRRPATFPRIADLDDEARTA